MGELALKESYKILQSEKKNLGVDFHLFLQKSENSADVNYLMLLGYNLGKDSYLKGWVLIHDHINIQDSNFKIVKFL